MSPSKEKYGTCTLPSQVELNNINGWNDRASERVQVSDSMCNDQAVYPALLTKDLEARVDASDGLDRCVYGDRAQAVMERRMRKMQRALTVLCVGFFGLSLLVAGVGLMDLGREQ